MRRAPLTLVLVLIPACHVGPRVNSFAPATRPAGIVADIQGTGGSFRAELLAVSDTGLLLLRDWKVMFARYGAIRHATFRQIPDELQRGQPPDSAGQRRLRLMSRFPEGASAERLRALLTAYHQDALVMLKP